MSHATGEPLGSFVFRLWELNGLNELVHCDEEGRFTTAVPVMGGPIEVFAGTGEGRPVERQLDLFHDGEPESELNDVETEAYVRASYRF